jgi:hypothetical protein
VVLKELSRTNSTVSKCKCQQLSNFDKFWLAKCKKNRGYSFLRCCEAFWKEFEADPGQWPLPSGTLSAFLGSKHIGEWAAKTLTTSRETSFRQRQVQYPKLDEALHLWLVQTSEGRGGTVSDAVALGKAKELGGSLGITGFGYSPGCL